MLKEELLETRKRNVLEMIVELYTATALPVSSQLIAHKLNLSSATIRHVMAELEANNYISHPYTSAGRIPTDKGYRLYVNDLMQTTAMSQEKKDFIAQKYVHKNENEYEEVFEKASGLLSRFCHYPGMVSTPRIERNESIKEIKIIPLDQKRILVTLITDTQSVKSKIIFLDKKIKKGDLKRLSNFLTNRLERQQKEEIIRQELVRELSEGVINQIEDLMELFILQEENVILKGANRLFEQPEFQDTERLKSVFKVFETSLLEILEPHHQDKGVCVSIGNENSCSEIQSCSLVTTSYKIKDKPAGAIGIIGPTRMKYALVIPIVEFMGRILEDVLKRLNKED